MLKAMSLINSMGRRLNIRQLGNLPDHTSQRSSLKKAVEITIFHKNLKKPAFEDPIS